MAEWLNGSIFLTLAGGRASKMDIVILPHQGTYLLAGSKIKYILEYLWKYKPLKNVGFIYWLL